MIKKAMITFLIFTGFSAQSQNISCSELKNAIENTATLIESKDLYSSTAISRIEYYNYDDNGFVIAYLKRNEYDLSGKPYIFCGISDSQWSQFTLSGILGSWGKSFNEYIKDNRCNCF